MEFAWKWNEKEYQVDPNLIKYLCKSKKRTKCSERCLVAAVKVFLFVILVLWTEWVAQTIKKTDWHWQEVYTHDSQKGTTSQPLWYYCYRLQWCQHQHHYTVLRLILRIPPNKFTFAFCFSTSTFLWMKSRCTCNIKCRFSSKCFCF